MDRWQTFPVEATGGVIESSSVLTLGARAPGALIQGQNIEGATGRGYRRINGFQKYDTNAVTGTGKVLGAFPFRGGVVAARGTGYYFSTGSGWSIIKTGLSGGKTRIERYNWIKPTICLVNSVDYPVTYDQDGTVTELTDAPQGATFVHSHKRHMVFIKDQSLFISAPGDETDFDGANGAAEINIGKALNSAALWRGELYIFGPNQISRLTGSSSADWAVIPVTERIGCIAPDSIQELAGDLYFLAQDGIRTISGTEETGEVNIDTKTRAIETRIEEVISKAGTYDVSSVQVPSKSQYRLFWGSESEPAESAKGLLGHLHTDILQLPEIASEWEWFDLKGIKVSCCDYNYENNDLVVVHGDYEGYVHQQELGSDFDGTTITSIMQFPWWYYGDPEKRKVPQKLSVYARREGGSSISLESLFDFEENGIIQPAAIALEDYFVSNSFFGTAVFGTNNFDSIADETAEVGLIGSGFFHSVKLTSNTSGDTPYIVDGFSIEFAQKGNR